ncbi:MAG: hypothetical protein FJY86_02950 [Candidatus Diapherotrites archaeon]|uniref:S-layer protein n=1 Tax=Candidatus Iainarchaeum sp. TaxID=3101447 RepID=A0A8T4C6S9_9ARCH|nr:hypothetical protein [Candidatus Diapherotrites archaeon]
MVSAITSTEAKAVVYSAEMSPNVNIVVGSSAAVSDGVWAGNIARKVVEKAVMEKVYTGGTGNGTAVVTDLAAVLSLGGTVTVSGGKMFDNTTIDSVSGQTEYAQAITQDPLSFLKDETVSYKFNGTTTSIDVKETIGVSLDARFSTDSDVRDLVAEVGAGDINYSLSLGGGIPTSASANSTTDFEDGTDDNIRIPFFGKTYLVHKVFQSDSNVVSEVKLIEDKAKQTFVAGESFNVQGKGDYAGQTLTVTVVSVVATGPAATAYQAKFNLTDEAGNVIDTQTVESGNDVEFEDSEGDEVVSGTIYLDSASVNTGTNEGTVDVLVGTSSLRLLDGENYPYDEQIDTDNVDGPYTVTLNETASANRLTSIVIANQEKDEGDDSTSGEIVDTWGFSVFDDDMPLYSKNNALTDAGKDGDYSFNFLDGTGALGEDFFTISFNGLENDEELTYIQIGNNEVTFRDAQDSTHTVPMWWVESEVGNPAAAGNDGKKFTFDGTQELWYDMNTSSTDFNVANGSILNGVSVVLTTNAANITLKTDGGTVDVNSQATTPVTINGITYTAARASAAGVQLTADGYIRFADSELTTSVSSSDLLQGLAGANNVTGTQFDNVFFYDDSNATNGRVSASTGPVLLPLSGDNYNVAYSFFVSEASTSSVTKGVYFMLAGNPGPSQHTSSTSVQRIPNGSSIQNSKNLAFLGTDTGEDGTVDVNYYFPQIDDLGQDDSSTTIYNSVFGVDENGTSSYSARVYIDNKSDQISNTDDTDISVPTSDVNYGWGGFGMNGVTFNLEYEDSDSLEMAWTDWGTKISIADNETAEFWIPENRPSVEFVVTGASSTTTVEDGEEMTIEEGETGTFTTGTQVTVKDITYTATVSDGSTVVTSGSGFTYTTPAALNGKAQVYTDAQSVAGPKIVVGGPAVNALATEVADMLNAAGDKVAGVYGSNIIVAGYTAADTGAAAQELISALDAI